MGSKTLLRDHLQNTAIPLAVNNVIPVLIVPSKNPTMYHLGGGTRTCPLAVTTNGHGRVTEPGSESLGLAYFGDDPIGFAKILLC